MARAMKVTVKNPKSRIKATLFLNATILLSAKKMHGICNRVMERITEIRQQIVI